MSKESVLVKALEEIRTGTIGWKDGIGSWVNRIAAEVLRVAPVSADDSSVKASEVSGGEEWKKHCDWFDKDGNGQKAEIFKDGFEKGRAAALSPSQSDEGKKENELLKHYCAYVNRMIDKKQIPMPYEAWK